MAPSWCLVAYMSLCWLTFAAGGKDPLVCFEPVMDMGVNEYAEIVMVPPRYDIMREPRDRHPLVYFYSRGAKQVKNRGAEVFHQLHDAVRAEGILSFIEEGVDEYRTDLSQFLHDQEDMTTSLNSHDIVVVTAISHSMSADHGFMLADYTGAPHLSNVSRLVKWQIGYSFPSIRYFVDEHHVQICDTHFLKDVFGCVKEAVIRAPPLPLYYEALEHVKLGVGQGGLGSLKERLVLIDDDHAFDVSKLPQMREGFVIKELKGMSRKEMIDSYTRAVAVVDLWLPGAETVTAEGAIFDCCIIVANEMNGANRVDFPIDPSLKISRIMGGDWNYTHIAVLLERALNDHSNFVKEFAALKSHVLGLPALFQTSVHSFFASDIHFVAVAPTSELQELVIPWAVSVLMNYPLASIQIIVPNRYIFGLSIAPVLELLQRRGLARSIIVTDRQRIPYSEHFGGFNEDFARAFQDEAVVCYCDVRKTFLRPGLTDVLEDMDGNQNSVDHGAGGEDGSRGIDRVDGGFGVECMLMSPYSTLPAGEKASSEKLRLHKLGTWEGLWDVGRNWKEAETCKWMASTSTCQKQDRGLSAENCDHLKEMRDNKIYASVMPYFPKSYVSAILKQLARCGFEEENSLV